MANITRREPFRSLMRGDPFNELRQMQSDMDRLMSQFFGRDIMPTTDVMTAGEWLPLVETYMKGDSLILKCELPGIDPKDVDVTYDQSANQLVIKGERKMDKDTKTEDYIYREVGYGKFERRFTLPAGANIDQMKAKYNNGMLEITVPKAAVAQAKKIQIEGVPAGETEKAKKAA